MGAGRWRATPPTTHIHSYQHQPTPQQQQQQQSSPSPHPYHHQPTPQQQQQQQSSVAQQNPSRAASRCPQRAACARDCNSRSSSGGGSHPCERIAMCTKRFIPPTAPPPHTLDPPAWQRSRVPRFPCPPPPPAHRMPPPPIHFERPSAKLSLAHSLSRIPFPHARMHALLQQARTRRVQDTARLTKLRLHSEHAASNARTLVSA